MATATIDNEKRKELLKTCKVTTGLGVISYAFLWEPRAEEEGKTPKYSTSFLIPKSDVKTLTKIKNAINAASELGQVDKWNGKIPAPLKHPLRDGDVEADEKGEEYRGHYFINANSTRRPRIVDLQVHDIIEQEEVYSGCKCRISVNFYPFNTNGNKGVACGLNHVQKIEDGEPLGGAVSKAEDDFADMNDLDLPFGEDGDDLMSGIGQSVAPAAKKGAGDDILAGINFGDAAA
jgi:hypothetical protein